MSVSYKKLKVSAKKYESPSFVLKPKEMFIDKNKNMFSNNNFKTS